MSNQTTATAGKFYAQPDDDVATRVKKFLGRNIFLLLSAVLFLITIVTVNNTMGDREDRLARAEAELLSLRQTASVTERDADADYKEAVRQATGGVDLDHKAEDDELVTGLLETALTWNGIPDYIQRREAVLRTYNLGEDSQFMKVFLPGEQEGVMRTDASGETHYAFDENISSRFEGMSSLVTNVNGSVYSYFTTVTLRNYSDSGQTSVLSTATLRYDVVGEDIINLNATIVPGAVKRSG